MTKGDVKLDAKEYAAVQGTGLQIHKEMDVPRQYVFLRTGIYDLNANKVGTLGMPLMKAPATVKK